MDYVKLARDLAENAHSHQKYGEDSYAIHLQAVVEILTEHGYDDEKYLLAGYLHDTLEDTDVSMETIEVVFGKEILDIVWNCSGFGKNRKERVADIFNKIRNHSDSCIVKSADRIANMRNAKINNERLFQMYAKEHQSFVDIVGKHINEHLRSTLEGLIND